MNGAGFREDRGSGADSVTAWGPESWGRQWRSSWTWLGFWTACSAPSGSRPGHRPHCFLKYLSKQTASLKGQSQRHRFLSGCWLDSRPGSRPGSQGDWLTFWGLEFKNKAAALAEMSGSDLIPCGLGQIRAFLDPVLIYTERPNLFWLCGSLERPAS